MDTVYWIWLSLAVSPGGDTFGKLLSRFVGAKEVFDATDDDIRSVIGSKSKDFRALCDKRLDAAQEILDFCTKKSVGLLTYPDGAYPGCGFLPGVRRDRRKGTQFPDFRRT